MNGRLLPFGWWRSCSTRARVDRVRVGFLGVKHEYRTPASPPGSTSEHLERGRSAGAQNGGEMGWILETNEPMNRAMEGMGGKVVKRYRLYERAL